MSLASQLAVGPGPVVAEVGVINDGDALVRQGSTIVGVPTSSFGGPASQLITPDETTLDVGAIGYNAYLFRGGDSNIVGKPSGDVFAEAAQFQLTPIQVSSASYDWDNGFAQHIAITHAGAACDVSLPVEGSVSNWPTNTVRRISKMNTSANGINLLVVGNCTINGGSAGADMSPIPDSNAAVSVSALGQSVLVFRESATAYWVWGAS